MKKLLLILSSAILPFTVHATTIVYSNFGPGNTYDPMFGYGIGNTNGTGLRSQAMQFTAGASGDIATVDLGLTWEDAPGVPVQVFLYGDAAGVPIPGSQILLGTATPTAQFQTTNNSIVTVNVASVVPVTMGTMYFLALMPTSPLRDSWQQTLPAVPGVAATSTDGGMTWFPMSNNAVAAFDVTANATVPDTGSTLGLLLLALLALFAASRFRSLRLA